MIELGSRLARGQSGSVHGKARVPASQPDKRDAVHACMHANQRLMRARDYDQMAFD